MRNKTQSQPQSPSPSVTQCTQCLLLGSQRRRRDVSKREGEWGEREQLELPARPAAHTRPHTCSAHKSTHKATIKTAQAEAAAETEAKAATAVEQNAICAVSKWESGREGEFSVPERAEGKQQQ